MLDKIIHNNDKEALIEYNFELIVLGLCLNLSYSERLFGVRAAASLWQGRAGPAGAIVCTPSDPPWSRDRLHSEFSVNDPTRGPIEHRGLHR